MTFTLTLTLDDANGTVRALRHYQVLQRFNAEAINATEDERLAANRELILVESLLRRIGVDPRD